MKDNMISQKEALIELGKRIKKYWYMLAGSMVFAVVYVVLSLYIPKLIGYGTDKIIDAKKVDFSGLKNVIFTIVICAIVAGIAQWIMGLCNNRITFNVIRDIREEAFAKTQRLPVSYIDSRSSGDIVNNVITDVDQLADGLLMGFSNLFTGVVTIVLTLIFMLQTNWKIALVVILITPVSFFVAGFIAKRTYSMFRKQSEIRGEQTALIDETISGIKVVKAFGQEENTVKRFDEVNDRLCDVNMKATFYSSITNPSTRFVNNLVYAGVTISGGLEAVLTGGITVGGLTCILSYANQYTKPFNEISGVVTELSGAFVCAGRIFELLDEAEEAPDSSLGDLIVTEGKVRLENVSFAYTEGQKLIENLSLTAEGGKRVAIVGRTGSGKTTLINLLMRFYDVNAGEITVDGTKIRTVNRKSLRSRYGMVLQETFLKTGTVRENLKIGRESATDEEMIAAAKACHAHGFISRLPQGYDTYITEEVNLSAGQKQLLCIARIMLSLPDMLILDEATSSVDTRTERRISDAFDKLMKGRTCFIVAHRLSTIKNADIILVMEQGNVVEQGNHETLLKKRGYYYNLYTSQFATPEN